MASQPSLAKRRDQHLGAGTTLFYEKPVHLVRGGGEQHGDMHHQRNAMEQVPVLAVNGVPYAQSLAILEFLEARLPDPPLLPATEEGRFRVRQASEMINSGIQPLQNLATMQKLERDFGITPEAKRAWSRDWISRR